MAGMYGAADVTISYDDAPGGSPQAVTQFVMELGGAKIEVKHQTSHSFGDSWDEHTPTGHRSSPPIRVSGRWNTTATTGPHVVFRPVNGDASPAASSRSLIIVFGDSKTFTVETRLLDYSVMAHNAELTDFEATIQPTGAAVWT